ncbi:MAG: PaaI family thioesterase [Burkholderiaceae bacterium]
MDEDLLSRIPFSKTLGIELVEAGKNGVRARLTVRAELCTAGHSVHGGVLMSLADSIAALGAYLNLPEGAKGTTTIESKTNFLAGAPEGSVLLAEALPVRVGRRLSVWQTRITAGDGQEVALITQSQLVL